MQERKLRRMQITTNKGKTHDITFNGVLIRNGCRVMIEMKDDYPLAEIAADFDGVDTFTVTHENRPGVKEVYEGFTRLADIRHDKKTGTFRLTLEKGDAA